jgi:hypothetical protein
LNFFHLFDNSCGESNNDIQLLDDHVGSFLF